MRILRSPLIGLCSGVRRAIQLAHAAADPAATAIYGELAHNPAIQDDLVQRGFCIHAESQRPTLPDAPNVLITAHGISQIERQRLERAGKHLIDGTCPFVWWIHESARRLQASGHFVIILGHPDHVETRGITEDLSDYAVISHRHQIQTYAAAKIGIVCQSTFPPLLVHQLLTAIRQKNPARQITFIPTTCRETLRRQEALLQLLEKIDALLVIGGKNSHNTLALVHMAQQHHTPCLHIASAAEIPIDWPQRYETIGLAAGTSTPDEAIDAVERRLHELSHKHEPAAVGSE